MGRTATASGEQWNPSQELIVRFYRPEYLGSRFSSMAATPS
jgi:hypothetical protein